jgi:flagellar hook-basal body complex protein FliE
MINEINPSNRYQPLIQQKFPHQETTKTQDATFANTLKDFVSEVSMQQDTAKELSEAFIKGENVEMHDVVIAGQKAKTSFQLLMELRTKGLDLYREVLRMQV